MSIIIKEEQNEVRRYLLGQLTEGDEERLELKLLTDPAFGEEFDTIVDEITDQYIENEFQGEERKRVEHYFFRSAERQNKVRFACVLLRHATGERSGKVDDVTVPSDPGLWERARLFWNRQALSLRFATTFATLIIVVGLVMLGMPMRNPTSPAYASVTLNISNAQRSAGSEITSVKPPPDASGIRIELILPDGLPQAKSYRVSLTGEQGSRAVPVVEPNARSVVVVVPTTEVPRGSYAIHLFAVNADGNETPIRGSYFFNVE